ncbi:MAG: aldehyde dehydrogenase family protein, partial [Myxococcales bacterium]|nr:aldehyde dehydrogenase family protein [Myxococcales bacterium]
MSDATVKLRPRGERAMIACHDPATGAHLGDVPEATPEEVRDAIARARAAQHDWALTSFAERRRVLRRLLEYILDHDEALCEAICQDAGKTMHNAMLGEIWPICEKLRWTIAEGERHLLPEPVSSGLLKHKRARIEFPPLGVIGVICPWNFPLQNILGPTIPALFAGNAVVVKVSEWVAWSTARFQEMLRQVFTDCGHSPQLVQLINGGGEAGAALVAGGVDKLIFTGSVANGRKVIAESARSLTPVVLEL